MGLYRKGRIWWFIKQYKGRRTEESLGTSNKRLAEKIFYEEKLPKILSGSYFEPPAKVPTIPTMKEVIERYIKEVSPFQKSHSRNQEIAAHFYDFLGDCLVCDVKPMLSEYKARRLLGEIVYGRGNGRKAGESTVKKELAFLRQVFSKAIDEWEEGCWDGYFKNNPVNPVKKIIKKMKDRKRVRYVQIEEASRLKLTLPQWIKPMVIVACQTGLRASNIVYLLVSYCDFKDNLINLPATEMKDEEPFPHKDDLYRKGNLTECHQITQDYKPLCFC